MQMEFHLGHETKNYTEIKMIKRVHKVSYSDRIWQRVLFLQSSGLCCASSSIHLQFSHWGVSRTKVWCDKLDRSRYNSLSQAFGQLRAERKAARDKIGLTDLPGTGYDLIASINISYKNSLGRKVLLSLSLYRQAGETLSVKRK